MKFSLTDYREVRKFFIIFYVIGTIGMVLPLTQALFIRLIPYSLLLNIAYLGYFHADKKSLKTVLAFISIAVLSFFIEMIGVESGLIFGTYAYGEGLGLKWHDTPLIIGVNWVILVYCSSAILEQYTHWKTTFKILIMNVSEIKIFNSQIQILNEFKAGSYTDEQIKNEPMFFNCDLDFAYEKGGVITKY